MDDERQLENVAAEAARNSGAPDRHNRAGRLVAKLRFFRAMLWVMVYATAGLFLMSVILLGGLRLQSKIIGGALVFALALIAASYGLQWYS